jgi:hypothetical protein
MWWVVRAGHVFLEVWIFRNVWDGFQNFVTHHLAASTAIRKNSISHQDHAGAWFILMANLIDARLLDEFSRGQRAIGLVI